MKSSNQGTLAKEQSNHTTNDSNAPQLKCECILESWKTVKSSSKFQIISTDDSSKQASSERSSSSSSSSITKRLPLHMPSSKRDTLTLLQSTCPVDFLRKHHLNVSLDVALRKFNKGKLQAIWDDYGTYCNSSGSNGNHEGCQPSVVGESSKEKKKGQRSSGSGSNKGMTTMTTTAVGEKDDNDKWDKMERTFRSLLLNKTNVEESVTANASDGVSTSGSSIAAYLHESCNAELPCWAWDTVASISSNQQRQPQPPQHIHLFLGAVRDMTAAEQDALSRACRRLGIPLIPCRLGPVPEFTSKIVSVAGHHFRRGVLGQGLVALSHRREKGVAAAADDVRATVLLPRSNRRTLHTIAIVPIDAPSLDIDLSNRNRILWCMVRLCVCSLWRSKLASSSGSSSSSSSREAAIDNTLTFLFQDGVQMTLTQKDFIHSLAKKHKAAPTERQILEELCDLRDRCASSALGRDGDNYMKQTCDEILSASVPSSLDNDHDAFALDYTGGFHEKRRLDSSHDIMDLAYSNSFFHKTNRAVELDNGPVATNATLFAILHVGGSNKDDEASTKHTRQLHQSLLRAFSRASIPVRDQSPLLDKSSQDREACTVIVLQHLDYQGRLFRILQHVNRQRDDCLENDIVDDDVAKEGRVLRKKKKKGKKRKRSTDSWHYYNVT